MSQSNFLFYYFWFLIFFFAWRLDVFKIDMTCEHDVVDLTYSTISSAGAREVAVYMDEQRVWVGESTSLP